MKKLFVVSLASDVYKQYIPAFVKSVKNLKWIENKGYEIYVVMMLDEDCEIETEFPVIKLHIPNLPYSSMALTKTDFVFDAIAQAKASDDDSFMFFDIDSYVIKMNEDKQARIFELLTGEKVCFTRTPWRFEKTPYLENFKNIGTYWFIKDMSIENYVQNSFFFGTVKAYKQFYKKYWMTVNSRMNPHKGQPVIPYMHDQSMTNKVVSLDYSNYVIDDFVFNGYDDKFSPTSHPENLDNRFDDQTYENEKATKNYVLNDCPNIFVIQKFDKEIKKTKRIPPLPIS